MRKRCSSRRFDRCWFHNALGGLSLISPLVSGGTGGCYQRVPFLDQELTPVSLFKDFSITLDSHLNFNDHVNTLTSSLLSMLCQISRVRHLFRACLLNLSCQLFWILLSLVNFFTVPPRCSTVWAGTSKQNLLKLQLVQNSPPAY